jgi:transglutaminase-like putative cysteine protease
MQDSNIRKLADIKPEVLLVWFEQFDQLGSADMILTDGNSLVCFHGTQSQTNMYYTRRKPPSKLNVFDSEIASIDLKDPRDTYRTALIFSSSSFPQGDWHQMQSGQLLISRRGSLIWDNKQGLQNSHEQQALVSTHLPYLSGSAQQALVNLPHLSITNLRAMTHAPDGKALSYRTFDVTHITSYEYEQIVEHSTHRFRLQPIEDQLQEVVLSSLKVSTGGEEIRYEDVFGNQSVHYSINLPYAQLSIESKSRVKVFACPPDDHSLSRRQTTIPLVWMPWQRQMMMAYLLPPELPETQLVELTDYAMSFVERNDYSLHHTLEDINQSIYNDYKYVQGTTSLNTTPFEVYTARKGVCQDFANLFICLARLLNIPARYRTGYIYTGANYENKLQSEASHAWAEVYLPYVGWRGYDPTNGCSVAQDHIRVACGRNYRDATPTSGTIFKGGGSEKLSVTVRIEEVNL